MSSSNDHEGRDPFAPPEQPIVCFCLHCGEEFDSWQMVYRPRGTEMGHADPESDGDWCCPTPGCGGVGFGFDIFPSDEDWRDEHGDGWAFADDSDEDFDFEGVVDDALIDQFWREDPTALSPDCAPDDLQIDTEGLEDHPLKRLLPPEELPAEIRFSPDDIPF